LKKYVKKISSMAYAFCMITPQQIRSARALVGLTQAALAKRAGLSTTGLNNIERGVADPKASTLRAIQSALEAAGVKFTDGGGVKPRRINGTQSD
jgi:predicted transcriptional regulator